MVRNVWSKVPSELKETVKAHQHQAPVKLSTLAKALGVKLVASTLPAGISGEIRPDGAGGFTVRVNRHDSPRRQRFTVAHELAHFLLHREQIGTGIADDVLYRSSLSDWRESEANRLAADLLMPPHLVTEEEASARALGINDLQSYLADKFEVSEAAMRISLEA